MDERAVSEYVYCSHGEPLANDSGEIALARKEIVRCRDCAYIFRRKYNNGFECQTCSYFDSEHAEVELDGFCAWATKREEVAR